MPAPKRAEWRRQQARAASTKPVVETYENMLKRERLHTFKEKRANKRQKKSESSKTKAKAPKGTGLFDI